MIDAVKVIDAQNLPEEIVSYKAEDSVQDGVRVIRADVSSDELVHVQLVLKADHVPYEQYGTFDTYIGLLNHLNTDNYTTDALTAALLDVSGGFSVNSDYMDISDGGFTPTVCISWDCLPENIDACFELVREIIRNTDTADLEHARRRIAESNQMISIYMNMDPSEILKTALMGYVNPAQRFSALDSMGDCFEWYMNRTNWSDEELAAALKTGKEMLLDGMHKENLIVCSVSSKENNDLAVAAGLKLASELSDEPSVHYDYTKDMAELPESIAFPMDIDVGYNGVAASYQDKIIYMCQNAKCDYRFVSNKSN